MKQYIDPRMLEGASLDYPTGCCVSISYSRIFECLRSYGAVDADFSDKAVAVQANQFGLTFVLEKK